MCISLGRHRGSDRDRRSPSYHNLKQERPPIVGFGEVQRAQNAICFISETEYSGSVERVLPCNSMVVGSTSPMPLRTNHGQVARLSLHHVYQRMTTGVKGPNKLSKLTDFSSYCS